MPNRRPAAAPAAAEASEPGDGGLPTVLPAFVISDYHSYILPGLTRHVEAAPFHQAGLKLDKPRYVSIFLEKKVRTLMPHGLHRRRLTRICE